MRLALDYDQTYTLDPSAWNEVISTMQLNGHDIRVVTVRSPEHDRTEPLIALEKIVPVFYTNGVAKRWWLSHFGGGFMPDVWIDDKPESILENSTATPDFLVDWRANRDH
jgi:hypothetical protein